MVAGAGVMPALAEIVYTPANYYGWIEGWQRPHTLTDMAFFMPPRSGQVMPMKLFLVRQFSLGRPRIRRQN